MNSEHYDNNFYEMQQNGSYKSAKVIVPILNNLFKPNNVIDVGSGLGTWSKVFIDLGINDVLAIDGDYVDLNKLFIPKDKFLTSDLNAELPINRKFDLAISLEVAEHLPVSSAENFIKTLTSLSNVIYFSAAIPFQGGTNHQNEQWQSYWAEKFKQNNYSAFDIIRNKVWDNEEVMPCYAQNGIVYINENHIDYLQSKYFTFKEESDVKYLSIVHPKIFESIADPDLQTVRNQFNILSKVLKNRILHRLKVK